MQAPPLTELTPSSASTALNGANTGIESTAGDGTHTTEGRDDASLNGAPKAAARYFLPQRGNNGADQPGQPNPAGPTFPVKHPDTMLHGEPRDMVRIEDLNPAYNKVVNLSGKTPTPRCMLCFSSELSYGPTLHACGCSEPTHAYCHGVLSPERQETCPRCSFTINYEWVHEVQKSSEDEILDKASLRTAAFEQQHEDRSHALVLHSADIVGATAWYETLKLHVPIPLVLPIEHTRRPKVLIKHQAVPWCNNGRQNNRFRRRATCSVHLPSVGDDEFAERQRVVAASFNPADWNNTVFCNSMSQTALARAAALARKASNKGKDTNKPPAKDKPTASAEQTTTGVTLELSASDIPVSQPGFEKHAPATSTKEIAGANSADRTSTTGTSGVTPPSPTQD